MTKKSEEPNICPQCRKNPGFHYIYTTSKGVFCSKECADKYEEYRLKPKEIYEWRWYRIKPTGTFYTEQEMKENSDNKWVKLESSKRIRND